MSPRPSLPPNKRTRYSDKKISLFAKNLQIRRLELDMKQDELAKLVGTSNGTISKYEAGVFPNTPERIIALAKALNVSIDWLFGFKPD